MASLPADAVILFIQMVNIFYVVVITTSFCNAAVST